MEALIVLAVAAARASSDPLILTSILEVPNTQFVPEESPLTSICLDSNVTDLLLNGRI